MSGNNEPFMDDPFLNGNEIIEKAIEDLHNEGSKEKLIEVLESIRTRMHADGHLIFPVQIEDDGETFAFRTIQTDDGNFWQVAFTSQKEFEKGAESGKGLESLVGQTFSTCDNVRLVPDILQNGDNYFFPVFTSDEEMGEYGKNFSKIEKHFLEAIILAKNNEKKVTGIVINAFSNPFEIDKELFELVEKMESSLEATDES